MGAVQSNEKIADHPRTIPALSHRVGEEGLFLNTKQSLI
jgi:hypothetical protein